jgi:hypothetical protein
VTHADIDAALAFARAASARADAATPGPWLHVAVTGRVRRSAALNIYTADVQQLIVSDSDTLDTAEFIAAARSDVPALAGAVRRLANEVRTLRAILSDATSESAMYAQGVRDSLAVVEAVDASADGGSSTRHGVFLALGAVRTLLPENKT